jgi:hypothetical protein
MAKLKKKTDTIGGPFLAAAVFCENILEGKDGMMSAMNIVDGCKIQIHADAPPEIQTLASPIPVSQNALVIFRTGDSPGKHKLTFVAQGPDGKRHKPASQEIKLGKDPNGGMNVKVNAAFAVHASGVYWLDVMLDGKRVTMMPLNVDVQRDAATPAPAKSRTKS